MVPKQVLELSVDGAEVRPIPGYEGFYLSKSGMIFTIRVPRSQLGFMHPDCARILNENCIKIAGHKTLYKRHMQKLTFPEG